MLAEIESNVQEDSITRPKDTESVCTGKFMEIYLGGSGPRAMAASLPHPNLLWPSCSMLAPVAAKGNRKQAKMRATSPAASKVLVTKVPSKCKKGGNSKIEKSQPHGKTIQSHFLVSPVIGECYTWNKDSSARKHFSHNSCRG